MIMNHDFLKKFKKKFPSHYPGSFIDGIFIYKGEKTENLFYNVFINSLRQQPPFLWLDTLKPQQSKIC